MHGWLDDHRSHGGQVSLPLSHLSLPRLLWSAMEKKRKRRRKGALPPVLVEVYAVFVDDCLVNGIALVKDDRPFLVATPILQSWCLVLSWLMVWQLLLFHYLNRFCRHMRVLEQTEFLEHPLFVLLVAACGFLAKCSESRQSPSVGLRHSSRCSSGWSCNRRTCRPAFWNCVCG